jgi:phosphoribosylformimino-5-aminoimidazole carboxamide ribotide isomerase
MIIIPAIDIIDGKCVRLTKGDYAQKKVYNDNPVEVAKQFEDAGIERLHVVDLDGAKAGKVINLAVLENIAAATKLKIDFGGGVKTINDVESIFEAGAAMVTIGSLAGRMVDGIWCGTVFYWRRCAGRKNKNQRLAGRYRRKYF